MINTREIAAEYRLSHLAQIMRDRTQSGLSIKAFCNQIGICGNTYFYWQRKLREAACEQLSKLEPAQKSLTQVGFAEIKVAQPPAVPEAISPSRICIEIGEMRITVDESYPPDKLAVLIRELTRPC